MVYHNGKRGLSSTPFSQLLGDFLGVFNTNLDSISALVNVELKFLAKLFVVLVRVDFVALPEHPSLEDVYFHIVTAHLCSNFDFLELVLEGYLYIWKGSVLHEAAL